MNVDDFLIIDDLQLMGYGESDSSGCWMKFQILPGQLELLRGLKSEMFEVAIKLLDNQHQAAKIGRLCIIAIELSEELLFQRYAAEVFGGVKEATKEHAKAFICFECGIESRKELDTNENAARCFAVLRTKYANWKNQVK